MPNIETLAPFSPADGTRKQYTSGWRLVTPGADGAVTFTHDLGEIPWQINVIQSEDGQGKYPVQASATTTATKTTIIVTSTASVDAYFQVRAL